MKLLKQIKELQTLSVGGGSGSLTSEVKQDTVVNILVRIELIEQEIRSLKNQDVGGALTERASRGMNRRGSLKEFEESRVQINELKDMYTQLNRMVENLILRIAD